MDKNKQELNPYEAPKSIKPFSAEGLTEPAYADGMDLVFTKKYKPSRICLMTGERVGEGVKPFPCGLIGFKLRNSPLLRAVVAIIFLFYIFSIAVVDDFKIKTLGYIALFCYLGYAAFLGQVKFYYTQGIRAREMKRLWKMGLLMVPSMGLLVYGLVGKNYILVVLGGIIFLNLLFILYSRGVLKFKQGDKQYYRLGDIHPAYLARLPNLNEHRGEHTELTE